MKQMKTKILFVLLAAVSPLLLQAQTAINPPEAGSAVGNLPPMAVNDALQRGPESRLRVRAARLLANDSDPANEPLTFVSVGATSAAGGTVVTRAKWIFYNPPAGFTNADSFTYVIANSSGLMATGSVSITIREEVAASENVVAREVLANGDTRVQFVGIPGRTYRIQYTENLETPRWRPLGRRIADATGQFEFTDSAPRNSTPRFYRSTNPGL